MNFPNDVDGQVLKDLFECGVDFNETQDVDFFVLVPDQRSGEAILKIFESAGINSELVYDEI